MKKLLLLLTLIFASNAIVHITAAQDYKHLVQPTLKIAAGTLAATLAIASGYHSVMGLDIMMDSPVYMELSGSVRPVSALVSAGASLLALIAYKSAANDLGYGPTIKTYAQKLLDRVC